MNGRTVSVILGGVVLSGVLVWSTLRAGAASPEGSDDGLRAELAETRNELHQLKEMQARILAAERDRHSAAASPEIEETSPDQENGAQGQEDPEAPGEDPFPSEEEVQRVVELERKATTVRYRHLADDLAAESRDAAWARDVEGAYKQSVQMQLGEFGAHLRSVECRETLCKMEVYFPDLQSATSAGPRIAHHESIRRSTLNITEEDDRVRVEYFMARGERSIRPLSPEDIANAESEAL